MLYAIQEGNKYVLKFRYDPNLIPIIKNVPGRMWNPTDKVWTIPAEHLGWLLNEIKGTVYENQIHIQSDEDLNVNATLDSTDVIPDIDISDMEQYVKNGAVLYQHQIDFLKYAKNRAGRGFILSDEQGCGKTLEVMNYALYMRKVYGYRHCLIITCVNSAKYSWQADIETHTNGAEQAYILGTRLKRNGQIKFNTTSEDKVQDLKTNRMYGDVSDQELPYFLITNIESLRTKFGKHYTLVEEIINMVEHNELQMIAIDEVHKNMSPKSTQGKLILEIKKKTGNSIEWIPMTGTPIVNKPTDVYTPLKLVNGHSIKNYWLWQQQFCVFGGYGGHEIMAYKNIPFLKEMLQKNMIRRLKKDVLDLPPKIYYTEYVENTPIQQKLYYDIQCDMLEHEDEILESMNPLTQMLRLRQVNGCPELIDNTIQVDDAYLNKNAKLARLIELVDEIVERGEKVVIFSNWVNTLKPVYRFISAKYKTTCFTGSMSEADREKHKRVFLNNPNYKVMLGTIGALGVNHTLTVANNVIFIDEPWTPSDKVQAEDRCFVAGTKIATPNGYIPIEKLSIDDKVYTPNGTVEQITDHWKHIETANLVKIHFIGCPEPIICTEDHKFLIEGMGWVDADKLCVCKNKTANMSAQKMIVAYDDMIISSIPTNFNMEDLYFINNWGVRQLNGRMYSIPENIELSSDFLFFCGYYIGDGCVSKRKKISLAGNGGKKLIHLTRIKNWFESTFEGRATIQPPKGHKVEMLIHNASFAKFITTQFGRVCKEKHFPDWISKLNYSQLHSLFDGLCASDGYYRNTHGTEQQEYCTINDKIATGVWYIMSRLGYKPTVRLVKPKRKDYHLNYVIQCSINPKYRLKTGMIKSIEKYTDTVELYDITVSNSNSFYVWNIPVHNCHRISANRSVNIYTLLSKGTIDETVHKIVYDKQDISNFIVDGKLDLRKNPELFEKLLGKGKN